MTHRLFINRCVQIPEFARLGHLSRLPLQASCSQFMPGLPSEKEVPLKHLAHFRRIF
jgi:hypothetical protein